MSTPRTLFLAALSLSLLACDAEPPPDDGDAPLSDYDALMEGAPSNDELPFEIKADGPAPIVHTELLDLQSPVRSQGRRGTCSIFSTTALMEHLYIVAGAENPDFSEQYLQWSTKFEVGAFGNTSGSNASINLQAINRFGIPRESDWRYDNEQWDEFDDPECAEDNENKPTRCYTNGAPPAEALEAEKFHLPPGRFINTRRESIIDHIRVNGTGVVVGLDFFYQSWNHRKSDLPRNMDNWAEGIVLYPNDEDIRVSREKRAGHSILIVGWDLEQSFPRRNPDGSVMTDENGETVMETGFFIFKNSWGTGSFGVDNPHGNGYGWLSMEYAEDFGRARISSPPDLGLPPPDDDGDGGDDDGGAGEGQTLSSSERLEIPDNRSEGVTSTLVAEEGEPLSAVTVKVDITHTFRGDLLVTLAHGGVVTTLHNRSGGGQHDLTLELELDDFEGMDPKGDWTLHVVDTARIDTGTVDSWSLNLE